MADNHLRAMTWNVWWRFGPDWRARQPALWTTIERCAPDLLALQESWSAGTTSQAAEWAQALGFHAAFGAPSYPRPPSPVVDPDHAGIELGIALISRWPISRYELITMPARHRPWDPVILRAVVDHPAGPLPILVACLEYATTYSDDRIAQAAQLADLATDPAADGPCPSLVMGDLNAAPDSAVLRPMRDVLIDAWKAGNGDPDAVTLPSSHPSAPLAAGPELVDQRIDHIFYRPGHEDQLVTVSTAFTLTDALDGVLPSDHRPVICDFTWHDR